MAEASETHNTTGTNVAVGNNNRMNITYNNQPPVPPNLPAGSRVTVTTHVSYTIGDQSGAASSAAEEEQEQQQQQQQYQPPNRGPPSQRRQQGQSQHTERREQAQPRPPNQRSQPQHFQQSQRQLQHPSPHQHSGEQQEGQQPLYNANQASTSRQPLQHSQQETSPPAHPSSPMQSLPRQRSVPEAGQGERSSLPKESETQIPKGPTLTSQASYSDETGPELPYSLDPPSNYPAMPIQHQAVQESQGSPTQGTNGITRPTLSRSTTDPTCDVTTAKTPVSFTRSAPQGSEPNPPDPTAVEANLYSLDPRNCPQSPATHTPITPLRILPKSNRCTTETVVNTKVLHDEKCPDISDIISIRIDSVSYLVVSDMGNRRIKIVKKLSATSPVVSSLRLNSPPISVSPFKESTILVGYKEEKRFSIVNIIKMKLQESFQTKRQYCGIIVLNQTELAACCQESLAVDILNYKGNLLKSLDTLPFKFPCHIFAASSIFVTDWMAKTLTCLSKELQVKFIVSPTSVSKSPTLRGVVQSGSNIFVADESGDRILCFDVTGKRVNLLLDEEDGISQPCGLCFLDNTLFIAQSDGLIMAWRQRVPEVTDTRM